MKNNKYGSEKVLVDGYIFDSKLEARYYEKLKKDKAKGIIVNFELQPRFELQPKYKKNGKTVRAITYSGDFLVYHRDGSEEVIDIKGFSTQQGEIRRKIFEFKYPEKKLTWLSYVVKYGGWIEYDQLQKLRRESKKKWEKYLA